MSELKWIKHDGGPMPVPGDTIVEYYCGGEWPVRNFCSMPVPADEVEWHKDYVSAYAVVTPSANQPAIDAHYTKYAIQPMEFSLANKLDAAQHTVIKYTVRYRDKGGIRDLRAAIRVLELMIEREEKAQANG